MSTLYLTGMPGVGKTTVTKAIEKIDSRIEVIRYSSVLKSYLKDAHNHEYTTAQLREKSSTIISVEDVNKIDKEVVQMVKRSNAKHVILESHAITVEEYGYRATPFSTGLLTELNLDSIVVLYANPTLLQIRINSEPTGRRKQTLYDLTYGQNLQSVLALQYSILLGAKISFIDTNHDVDYVARVILEKVIDES